jgi:hypothetical protein
VATSIENFSVKLSKKATRCIHGQRFDVVKAERALEQITDALYSSSESNSPSLWLGPGICSTTLRRQREHIQSLDAFVDSVQVWFQLRIVSLVLTDLSMHFYHTFTPTLLVSSWTTLSHRWMFQLNTSKHCEICLLSNSKS